ncbi:hypothetical protein OSTOST_12224 [Ostertagia ostertagi]
MVHLLTCRALGAEAEAGAEVEEEEATKAEAEAEAGPDRRPDDDEADDEGVAEERTCRLVRNPIRDVAAEEDLHDDRANAEAPDAVPEEDRVVAAAAVQPHLAAPRRREGGGVVAAAVHRNDLAEDDECRNVTLVDNL